MIARQAGRSPRPFQALRQFSQRGPVEHCNLCNVRVDSKHAHLIDPANRRILCACQPCSIVFDGSYKPIPRRIRFLDQFELTDKQWNNLAVPINMAFFFQSTAVNEVIGLYPSPAGAIESAMPPDKWREIAESNPALNEMEPDVEALLVNRLGPAKGHEGPAYYILPIDECFRLVGMVRTHWRGLSGGTEVWREIGHFFAEMKERSCQS
jgi:hypothetical protein